MSITVNDIYTQLQDLVDAVRRIDPTKHVAPALPDLVGGSLFSDGQGVPALDPREQETRTVRVYLARAEHSLDAAVQLLAEVGERR